MEVATYDGLAPVYDRLLGDVDPVIWGGFVEDEAARWCGVRLGEGDGAEGRLLALDLGCGTGSVAIELIARGFDVIGVDVSEGMLSQARAKAADRGISHGDKGLTLIRQDIADFELFGTVDVAICLLDTVNHLLDARQVRSLFRLCAQYLNPGGVFIFDLATEWHFVHTRGDQIFYDLGREVAMIWKSQWQPRRKISRADLSLFAEGGDGRYDRTDVVVRERAYPVPRVLSWLSESGLRLAAQYGNIDRSPVTADSERIFLTAVKPPKLDRVKGEGSR